MSRSDECAERVMAIVLPRYLVKLAVAGAVYEFISDTESSDDSKLSDEFPVMLPGLDKLLKK